MVWGGITWEGKTQLHIIRLDKKETMTSSKYIDVLKKSLVPSMKKMYKRKDWYLYADNAPVHNSKETQNYLYENNIYTLDVPPYSYDLNPIEHIWGIIKKKIYK